MNAKPRTLTVVVPKSINNTESESCIDLVLKNKITSIDVNHTESTPITHQESRHLHVVSFLNLSLYSIFCSRRECSSLSAIYDVSGGVTAGDNSISILYLFFFDVDNGAEILINQCI